MKTNCFIKVSWSNSFKDWGEREQTNFEFDIDLNAGLIQTQIYDYVRSQVLDDVLDDFTVDFILPLPASSNPYSSDK